MSFLLSVVAMVTMMTSEIRWTNDILYLPLHDNVDDYRFRPEASLYIDGVLKKDPLMYYERNGVERTFISTVNTSVVKSYTIKYRVHFPTYNVSSTKSIVFVIQDKTPPVISKTPHFRVPLGSKMPNLSEGFVTSDNYDAVDQLIVVIQSNEVILSRVGKYPVNYQVTDVSGNSATSSGSVEVYDYLPPEIIPKKAMIIEFGQRVSLTDFFTIKDNYDAVLNIIFDDSKVDYSKLGSYPISIKATDQSGLSTTIFDELSIIDTESPIIIFKSTPKIIPVHQVYDREQLLDFILSVRDNVDFIEIDHIHVNHDIEFDTLGSYSVYYSVSDSSNNQTSTKLIVKVADLDPPKIWLTEPLVFDVFSKEPFLLNMIDYEDNYTGKSLIVIKMTGTFKMNIVGHYPITFSATDSSGNTQVLMTYVHIKDQIPPVVTQINDIVITDFTSKVLTHHFTFTDQYDTSAQLSIWIDDHDVDYAVIGEYPIRACAKDRSENLTCLDTSLIIADIIEPVLMMKTMNITAQINQTPIDLRSLIESLSDNYDTLEFSKVQIYEQINYQVPGRYEVVYMVTDSSLNLTTRSVMVIVDDFIPPVIHVPPITLFQYQPFDTLEGIEYSDDLGPIHIHTSPELIDTSVPGTFVIVYIAQDSRGNYTSTERLVTILPDETTYTWDAFIPLAVCIVLGLASLYTIYRKMS